MSALIGSLREHELLLVRETEPAAMERDASSQAQGARRQAKRDSR